jgi:hypothetical protein
MSYFQYRSNESFEEFVIKSLKSVNKDLFPKKFTVKDFKRLNIELNPENTIITFVMENGYEIKIVKQENNYYEFNIEKIPESFNLLFGCELETCMNLDCISDTYNDFIKSELNFLKNEDSVTKWKNLILFHLQINIIPYLTPAFLKRFKYAYIMPYHAKNAFYVDLSTGTKISSVKKVDEYKTLQFAQDGSVKCGDTDPSDNNLSVHCEIISPILSNLSEIKLLYDNIISKTCNYSNSSTGFHVNISIVDEHKVPYKFSPSFQMELFKNWYNFEEAHYEEYRGEGTFYAKRLGNYVKDNEMVNVIYSKKSDDSVITTDEALSDYGLKQLIFMEKTKQKMHSIYKKSDTILECRVFPSKNDGALLLDYTKKALDVVKKSMDYYIKNYMKLQDLYIQLVSKYKLNYITFNINNYSGSIIKYDKLCKYFRGKDYDGNIINLEFNFKEYETTIETQEIINTTFLLIFDNVKVVKNKKTFKGLINGDHHYIVKKEYHHTFVDGTEENAYHIQNIDINYDPDNDFVEIKNYSSKWVNK